MPTARSWTDRAGGAELRRAAADVRHLLRFRVAGLRGRARRAAPVGLGVIGALTLLAAVLPALVPATDAHRRDLLLLLPSALLGVLVISTVSAVTSGGGRELLPREQAVAFPVSPVTDHLGALLMAPLNIAWLLQCWAVLGGTSYALGARPTLVLALAPVVLWVLLATAVAQALAWAAEWVRRGRHGLLLVRTTGVGLAALAGWWIATDRVTDLLDASPTVRILHGVLDGAHARTGPWLRLVLALAVVAVAAVAVGGWLAGRVAARPARDELRQESAGRAARPHPGSDLVALLRTDRAGIWRSVPMRRGLVVLALFPGLVALGSGFTWDTLAVFPGLVASGGALLFGVNAWCLDGRGALWRDSLPVGPRLVFVSRAVVLTEILLVACAVTLALAAVRAGAPTTGQLVAVLAATVVVTLQVVATSLRWSVHRPYAVNLRSARATPAPPLVMVGYSARLALTTTFTGLMFDTVGRLPSVWSLALAVPFLAWSGGKLLLTAGAWARPEVRAWVVATVAG